MGSVSIPFGMEQVIDDRACLPKSEELQRFSKRRTLWLPKKGQAVPKGLALAELKWKAPASQNSADKLRRLRTLCSPTR
eukprot:4725453-Amphidinium_carterae.2